MRQSDLNHVYFVNTRMLGANIQFYSRSQDFIKNSYLVSPSFVKCKLTTVIVVSNCYILVGE